MTSQNGGCACGAVRFRAEGAPRFAFVCHCRACRRLTGTGHSVAATYDRDAVSVDGTPSVFERPSDSGSVVRQFFCGTCGGPLWNVPGRADTLMMINVGAFDAPETLTPDRVFHEAEALPWDRQSWHGYP